MGDNFYKGNMALGFRKGQGTLTWFDSGDVWEGEWRKDKLHGRGKKARANGSVIE